MRKIAKTVQSIPRLMDSATQCRAMACCVVFVFSPFSLSLNKKYDAAGHRAKAFRDNMDLLFFK